MNPKLRIEIVSARRKITQCLELDWPIVDVSGERRSGKAAELRKIRASSGNDALSK